MKTQIALCLVAAALAGQASAQTNVYKWTDKDGKVHFSDTPPPAEAKDAQQKRMGGGGGEDTQLPYATQLAAQRNPVTLYTGTDCGDPCSRGRELLARRGVPYAERDAQNNPADQEALKKLVGGLDVPTLVIGERSTKGYDEDSWQSALDAAGYPRTRLPGQAPLRQPPPPVAPAKPAEGAPASQ
jgi:glutaredoxin